MMKKKMIIVFFFSIVLLLTMFHMCQMLYNFIRFFSYLHFMDEEAEFLRS